MGDHPSTVRDVLTTVVAEQQRALLDGDVALRQGRQDAVHPTRVATRRLRSLLRVFATDVDPVRAAAFDTLLTWYAELLGDVRDLQVQRKRLVASAEPEFPGAAASLGRLLDERRAAAWQTLSAALASERYAELLRELDLWVTRAPFTERAEARATRVEKPLRAAERAVTKRLRRARGGDITLLHKARKAAKRARYAAEATSPVLGGSAIRAARRYTKLQDVLGEHQDSVVSAQLLAAVGPGSDHGYALGVLHERELRRARRCRKQAHRLARHLA